jgi:hypothetical protein
MGDETRPAMILDDVKGIKLQNVSTAKGANAASLVMHNVSGLSVKDSAPLKDRKVKQVKNKTY